MRKDTKRYVLGGFVLILVIFIAPIAVRMAAVMSKDMLMILGGAVFVLVIVAVVETMSIMKSRFEGADRRALLREDNASDIKQLVTVLKLLQSGSRRSGSNVDVAPWLWGQPPAYGPVSREQQMVGNGRGRLSTEFRDTVPEVESIDLE